MKDTPAQIASRFCEQLLAGRQSDPLSDLGQYFEAGGSVCALARKGASGLVNEYGLEPEDAQALTLRLNGLATWVLRSFIEDQLTGDEPLPTHLRQGLLALVEGPTYGELFKPNFGNKCPADAIEAIHSPVAYAVWLKHWSERRLVPSEDENAFALTLRRKDLGLLRVDPVTTHRVVSSVEVVSAVLEKSIKDSLSEGVDLDQMLSQRRYPNGLPYHHPWVTLDEWTRDLKLSVGRVVQLCDPAFPYFLRALPWGDTRGAALTQAARLSPALRQLMVEESPFPEGNTEDWFKVNFGARGIEAQNLNQTAFFNQRTKLTQRGLEALLSVESFAPSLSDHVLILDTVITPGHSGSVFVNNGVLDDSMSITYGGHASTNRIIGLIEDGVFNDRIDRLNRKIRLDNALQLPSHETDALLAAIIAAELHPDARAGGASATEAPDYWMTNSTVRALGLFQMLREDYRCSAEEFAAFVGEISIFGRGTELSQFDRVFNRDVLSTPPLRMDDGAFALIPQTEADALTVAQICGGLNIDLATYFNLAPLIASAQGLTELKRSRPVLSAFYRMARLPQLLGIAPNVAVEILNRLSGEAGLAALLGAPAVNTDAESAAPDALTRIQCLEGWVRWCTDNNLDVAWTLARVKPVLAPTEPSEAQARLFDQIRSQLAPVLFTEAALRMGGVSPLSNDRQWTQQLLELVDEQGLVIHRDESTEPAYEDYAREVVARVVRRVLGRDDPQTVEQIFAVLLSSRAGQRGVVQESLAVFGELAPPLALPVLTWAGSTVQEVLAYVSGRSTADAPSSSGEEDEPGDPFLGMLNGFTGRSEVVKALKLSAEFLALYLVIGDGVENAPATSPFTPSALYYLTVYNRAVALSQEPESQLLDYLRLVNGLPVLSGDGLELVQAHAAELLAELFGWSAEEVRVCAERVNGGQGYIRSLRHLDLFTRLREFSLQSTLDASTTLKVGTLLPDAPFSTYQDVADQVTARLADPDRTSPLYGLHAAGDRVEVQSTVGATELVANSRETTQLTVTVTLGQEPQMNVNVYWASTLCPVEPSVSTTNEDGQATVTVHAGTTMGRDVISYRLDAREPQPAVTITLGNDPSSFRLDLVDEDFEIAQEKVGTDVTLRALMRDRHGNPAAHESVMWNLDPLFDMPVYGTTNAQGLTEMTFTSLTPVRIPEPSVAKDDFSVIFEPIEFID
ncbi:Tc toxin subunit A [Pseudomonas mediterranea]|uniref:Tc toxin subunit A n=1 Tax=Pseudomonas mediterranea TaxID=183795 RepID=UPI0022341C00|nr:Tc toxin subunit A [Pseudomonas mediterranea]UZD99956.1 Tc toxin subunit A [Pseudomonas mediterranea]